MATTGTPAHRDGGLFSQNVVGIDGPIGKERPSGPELSKFLFD